MTNRKDPAFIRGQDAYQLGMITSQNPCQPDSPAHGHWLNGWHEEQKRDAQRDAAREAKAQERME